MTQYALIDPTESPFERVLGESGQTLLRHIIRGTACRAAIPIVEEQWEYRLFANGALALALNDSETRVKVRNALGDHISASPEAISLSMNLLALKDHQQQVPPEIAGRLDMLYTALKEALILEHSTVILPALQPDLRLRKAANSNEGQLRPHREARTIIQMEG